MPALQVQYYVFGYWISFQLNNMKQIELGQRRPKTRMIMIIMRIIDHTVRCEGDVINYKKWESLYNSHIPEEWVTK